MELNDARQAFKGQSQEPWESMGIFLLPGKEASLCLPDGFSHCYGQMTNVFSIFISFLRVVNFGGDGTQGFMLAW
jgi:hypothetical protein